MMLINTFSRRFIASSLRAKAVTSSVPRVVSVGAAARWQTTSVTYSGGQATEGQGGFYGSGGARVSADDGKCQHRPEMLALAADVQFIQQVMSEVEVLQHSIEKEESAISPQAIELKSTVKKILTSPQFMEALDRLEIQGSPVWGLSSAERQLIIDAREMVNEC